MRMYIYANLDSGVKKKSETGETRETDGEGVN